MRPLFEIDKAIEDFELVIDEETGEVLNAMELDNLQMERTAKIENVGLYYKNILAEHDMVKKERQAMQYREKVLNNKAESLKAYLLYALGGEKFNTPKVTMSYRKSKSIEIPNEDILADEWVNVKTIRQPDKDKIKKAIEAGTEVMGARQIEKTNIIIK